MTVDFKHSNWLCRGGIAAALAIAVAAPLVGANAICRDGEQAERAGSRVNDRAPDTQPRLHDL